MDKAGVDFALVAATEEGVWAVTPVPEGPADTLVGLIGFARQRQGEFGSVGFVSVADEFFVAIRVQGSRTRLLLSDANAIFDWPIAEEAADVLGLDIDEDAELGDIEPAGDLTLFADLGLSAADLNLLCVDPELYPDEQIGSIAARLGFGEEFANIFDGANA